MGHSKSGNFIAFLLLALLAGVLGCVLSARFLVPATPALAPVETAALSPAASTAPEVDLAALQAEVQRYVSSLNGHWSVSFQMLDSGEGFSCAHGVEATDALPCASMIRLWIMGTACEQLADGKLDAEKAQPLLSKMMRENDSTSANALVRLLGGGSAAKGKAAVTSFAEECGCTGTALKQLLPAKNDPHNTTTAADCTRILRAIGTGACISKDVSDDMLTLLLAQPKRVEFSSASGRSIPCAELSASLSGFCEGDAAIVYLPGGAYILSTLAEPVDNAAAAAQIQKLSQLVYDAMSGTS